MLVYKIYIFSGFLIPGATIISCFLDLIRRNVSSFCGSISRMALLAVTVSDCSTPAYWTVVELSNVVLIGMPEMKKLLLVHMHAQHQPQNW